MCQCVSNLRNLVRQSSNLKYYLLMYSVVSIQVTESEADVVPVFLYVLCYTAHVTVHTDVVQWIRTSQPVDTHYC